MSVFVAPSKAYESDLRLESWDLSPTALGPRLREGDDFSQLNIIDA
jgi:hypothetical protein